MAILVSGSRVVEVVRPPRQDRSRRSYRRLLSAAEELFDARGYEATHVAEIAGRAGLTVGAFYRRFPSKDALLAHLEDAAIATSMRTVREATDEARWAGRPLQDVVASMIAGWAGLYVRHRGVLRALLLRAAHDPAARRRLVEHNRETFPLLARFLASRPELAGAVPEARIEIGLVAVRGTLREALLFPESWPGERAPTLAELTDATADLLLRHLGQRPEPTSLPETSDP